MKKILLILLLLFILPSPLYAQSSFVGNINNSNSSKEGASVGGITVSPILTDVNINKGQSLVQDITVYNNSNSAVNVSAIFANFVSANEFGQPKFEKVFVGNINDPDLSLSTNGNTLIPPHVPTDLSINISASSNALPGEYFIGVFAKINNGVSQGNVLLNTAVGSLFLVRINGLAKETGYIKSFSANNFFYLSTPVKFQTQFVDTGNVHLLPQGIIEIYNMFGDKIQTIAFNPQKNIVLPVGVNSRIYNTTWNSSNLLLGQYTAKLILTYGYNTITTTQSTSTFWVLPLWFIFLLVLLFIFLLWQIVSRFLKR